MNPPDVNGLLRAENLAHKYAEQRRGNWRKDVSGNCLNSRYDEEFELCVLSIILFR